ncbi:hypothetical protein [Paenisporosarcina sp.]|uniref:hypothetical protein n=1 Tax=Paenisporosarcina sp. TaxID=1932001 RepID=UPI003C77D3C0
MSCHVGAMSGSLSTIGGNVGAIGDSLSTIGGFLSSIGAFVSTISGSPKIGTSTASGCP